MSTKIYDAFRIAPVYLGKLLTELQKFKQDVRPVALERVAHWICTDNLFGLLQRDESLLSDHRTSRHHHGYGGCYQMSVGIYVLGRYVYLKMFGGGRYYQQLRSLLTNIKWVEDYSWENATDDVPDGVSARSYAQRIKVWDKILTKGGTFSNVLEIEIIPDFVTDCCQELRDFVINSLPDAARTTAFLSSKNSVKSHAKGEMVEFDRLSRIFAIQAFVKGNIKYVIKRDFKGMLTICETTTGGISSGSQPVKKIESEQPLIVVDNRLVVGDKIRIHLSQGGILTTEELTDFEIIDTKD